MEAKLLAFLHRARRAKQAGGPSRRADFADGAYAYRDDRLGEGPFAGRESLWEAGRPVWAMNYLGRALRSEVPVDFLGEVLLAAPAELPWPGPAEYAKGPYVYRCAVQGDPAWFYGYAEVLKAGVRVYEYAFHGGAL
ncbi:MAG TPA: hypothetical protein H9668_04450 [Firmicutes bacterium]|nr:hypothetical protein [Bacillota bacterium]